MTSELADDAINALELVRKRSDGTFIARRPSDGSKFVLRRIEGSALELERLDRVCSLAHSNVLTPEGVVRKADHAIVVSTWVEGTTLGRIIAARRERAIPMEEDEALAIFSQVVHALAYAHAQDVVHCAISALSVTICTDGRVVLRDFDESNGDLRCPAPERCASVLAASFSPAHSASSNSWALGCLLFEMLSLVPLYDEVSGSELLRSVRHAPPPSLPEGYTAHAQDLVSALLSKRRATRPTPTDILAHPWMRHGLTEEEAEAEAEADLDATVTGIVASAEAELDDTVELRSSTRSPASPTNSSPLKAARTGWWHRRHPAFTNAVGELTKVLERSAAPPQAEPREERHVLNVTHPRRGAVEHAGAGKCGLQRDNVVRNAGATIKVLCFVAFVEDDAPLESVAAAPAHHLLEARDRPLPLPLSTAPPRSGSGGEATPRALRSGDRRRHL